TGVTPRVPDVPTYEFNDEQISWKSSEEEDDDEVNVSEHDDDNDDEQTKSDNDGKVFVHPKFSTHDDEARQEEVNEEDSFDPRVQTPSHVKSTDGDNSDEEVQGENTAEEEMVEKATHKEDEANELYRDMNETEDTHVILTAPIIPEGQQQSSFVSSGFVSNMLNPRPDTGIDSIFNTEATSLVDFPVTTIAEPPLVFATTLHPPLTPLITHIQQTPFPIPTTAPISSIPSIVDAYLANKMNEAVKTVDKVKEQVKAQVSKILPRIEKTLNEQLEAELMTRSTTESKTSLTIAANLSELELKKILIEKMESNKSIHRSNEQNNLYKTLVEAYESDKLILDTYGDTVSFKRRRDDEDKDEEPSARSNRGQASYSRQPWLSNLVRQETPRESFDELTDTPFDFSTFVMNRPKVETLTPELLAGPTFELMKGTCKSLVELEYFFEEVYKATTEQLDWHNPEGQQYPHDLQKPLPLITNSCGRQVIPFDHFINNELMYLCGSVLSQTYATFVIKTKSADYSHIKWIEELVPNAMWSQTMVNYGKYALWGISHWDTNVNNSMDLLSTGNLLLMYIPNIESSLSRRFRLSNGMATNIWIGSPFEEMMKSFTHSRKATLKGFAYNTSNICCFFLFKAS
ncbi:hypothetical protein Tco_1389363, partial [Tanacetum coccineum]